MLNKEYLLNQLDKVLEDMINLQNSSSLKGYVGCFVAIEDMINCIKNFNINSASYFTSTLDYLLDFYRIDIEKYSKLLFIYLVDLFKENKLMLNML